MEDCKLWLEVVKIIGLFVGFSVGLWQYRKAQLWKRYEFVVNEIRLFNENPKTIKAQKMLDWIKIYIKLPTETKDEDDVFVKETLLINALAFHEEKEGGFAIEESAIREIFDYYFDGLTKFQHFIDAELIKIDDIRPYLEYWIKLIGDERSNRMSEKKRLQIWTYITCYDFNGVERLCSSFGYGALSNYANKLKEARAAKHRG